MSDKNQEKNWLQRHKFLTFLFVALVYAIAFFVNKTSDVIHLFWIVQGDETIRGWEAILMLWPLIASIALAAALVAFIVSKFVGKTARQLSAERRAHYAELDIEFYQQKADESYERANARVEDREAQAAAKIRQAEADSNKAQKLISEAHNERDAARREAAEQTELAALRQAQLEQQDIENERNIEHMQTIIRSKTHEMRVQKRARKQLEAELAELN